MRHIRMAVCFIVVCVCTFILGSTLGENGQLQKYLEKQGPKIETVEVNTFFDKDQTSDSVSAWLTEKSKTILFNRVINTKSADVIVSAAPLDVKYIANTNYKKVTLGYSPVVAVIGDNKQSEAGVFNLYNVLKEFTSKDESSKGESELLRSLGNPKYELLIPAKGTVHWNAVVSTIRLEVANAPENKGKSAEEIEDVVNSIVENSVQCVDIEAEVEKFDKYDNKYILLTTESSFRYTENKTKTLNQYYTDDYVCEQLYMYYDSTKISDEQLAQLVTDISKSNWIRREGFPYESGYRIGSAGWAFEGTYITDIPTIPNILPNGEA